MICASSESPQDGTNGGYRPGRVLLEKYELLRPLAEGGMGVVWVAHNHVLDLDVAIKLALSGSAVSSDASRQRALSEARLAAQLAHPAVCRVLDFGLTEEGDPCVVTELLKGETLDSVLALEGKLAPVEAVQVILPILDALSASHEKGIIHRDVKPSNVYLARDAGSRVQPKLLDFGIAQGRNEAADWAVTGTVSGTPCYMSPEQACGADSVDSRTDIWSACATLYELLTGEPPFDGESCTELLVSVVQASPASLPADTAVDPWLSAILMRGLEKEPQDRWASAAELFAELSHWLLSRGVESDVCGHSLRARLRERGIGLRSVLGPDEVAGNTTLKSPGSGSKPSAGFPRRLTWKRALWFTTRGLPVAVAGIFALIAIRAYTPERATLAKVSPRPAAAEIERSGDPRSSKASGLAEKAGASDEAHRPAPMLVVESSGAERPKGGSLSGAHRGSRLVRRAENASPAQRARAASLDVTSAPTPSTTGGGQREVQRPSAGQNANALGYDFGF